jgi:hypothetical protein
MIVFRLTDELIRRNHGRTMAPILPQTIGCEWDSDVMSQSAMEWIVRFDSYSTAIEH